MTAGVSRRSFLRILGISIGAAAFTQVSASTNATGAADEIAPVNYPQMLTYGRALGGVKLRPDGAARGGTLWPDEVIPIRPVDHEWYQTPRGLVPAVSIQPLPPPVERPPIPTNLPFPALVGSAVTTLHQWASASAPIAARIGSGGLAWVVDRLLLNGREWFALAMASHGSPLGWSPGQSWHPFTAPPVTLADALLIDRPIHTLTVIRNDRPIFRTPIAASSDLRRGNYDVNQCELSTSVPYSDDESTAAVDRVWYAAPFALTFGEFRLVGAYWHNAYGRNFAPTDPHPGLITLSPFAAQWIYPRVRPGVRVTVR